MVSRRYQTAGWSSPVARRAHNPKVIGSNPIPATSGNFGWASREVGPPEFFNCESKL